MATTTLTASDSQTFVYPKTSYGTINGYYEYRYANTWYHRHSNPSDLEKRYQAGNYVTSGVYNGNMMSHFFFTSGGRSLKQFISSIGGPGKITSIRLRFTCGHAYYSAMNLNICVGPYWDTVGNYRGRTSDTYDGLGIRKLTTVSINKGETKWIDLTAHKNTIASNETICLYVPGAYNNDYAAYGWVYGHSIGTSAQRPVLEISYNTNSAPYAPSVIINSATDSHGYTVPACNFTVRSNGDPDNNLHSSPYKCQIFNQNGGLIVESPYVNYTTWAQGLSSYRGQTVKIRGFIRDAEGLVSTTDKNIYINSLPYWSGYSSEAVALKFTSGVTGSIFKKDRNITVSWPQATDAQSKHNSNLRYSVFLQKGTDNGPAGDNSSTRIANNIVGTSFTFAPGNVTSLNPGDRIYLSVWAWDGLESSSYRLTSSWIYNEKPPTAPSNVSPTSGHYESSVDVSWSQSQGDNGSTVEQYKIELLNSSNAVIKTYTTRELKYRCTDVGLIPRGQTFKFKVCAIDNMGLTSSPGYSGTLKRNSAPTNPRAFRVNSDKLYFKDSIPLTWMASSDADGDLIKYDIYVSINNGSFQELKKGITANSTVHDITGINQGSEFNYFIEAYDTYGIRSEKVFIAARPQVSITPEAPSILLPKANATMYCNEPRIVFTTNNKFNNELLEAVVTINGKEYRSRTHTALFNKVAYDKHEEGMFMVPAEAPLNYSNNNITIKLYDSLNYTVEKPLNIRCEAINVSTKEAGEHFITADDINSIKAMINMNRFAYGLKEVNWFDGNMEKNKTFIYKKYLEQAGTGIKSLVTSLNDRAKSNHLLRTSENIDAVLHETIKASMFNSILKMIRRS